VQSITGAVLSYNARLLFWRAYRGTAPRFSDGNPR